jgi:hypothetical protein
MKNTKSVSSAPVTTNRRNKIGGCKHGGVELWRGWCDTYSITLLFRPEDWQHTLPLFPFFPLCAAPGVLLFAALGSSRTCLSWPIYNCRPRHSLTSPLSVTHRHSALGSSVFAALGILSVWPFLASLMYYFLSPIDTYDW